MLQRLFKLLGLCLAYYLVSLIFQFLFHALHIPIDLTLNKGIGQVVRYLIAIPMVWLFARWVWNPQNGPSWSLYWRERKTTMRGFVLVAVLFLAVQAAWYSLLIVIGVGNINLHRISSRDTINDITAFFNFILLATTEEVLFRGFIFNYLRGNKRPIAWIATCLSALLFSLSHQFHGPLDWFNPHSFSLLMGLFLLGVLLAVVYQATGSLACGIAVHTTLVWVDVVRKRTDLMPIHQTHWWMGTNNDLRTAPLTWVFFLLLTCGFWQSRHWFAARTRIEDPAV